MGVVKDAGSTAKVVPSKVKVVVPAGFPGPPPKNKAAVCVPALPPPLLDIGEVADYVQDDPSYVWLEVTVEPGSVSPPVAIEAVCTPE